MKKRHVTPVGWQGGPLCPVCGQEMRSWRHLKKHSNAELEKHYPKMSFSMTAHWKQRLERAALGCGKTVREFIKEAVQNGIVLSERTDMTDRPDR